MLIYLPIGGQELGTNCVPSTVLALVWSVVARRIHKALSLTQKNSTLTEQLQDNKRFTCLDLQRIEGNMQKTMKVLKKSRQRENRERKNT